MGITTYLYIKLITVLVMVYLVFAGEEDCLALDRTDGPIKCFECLSFSSIDDHCGDPFNSTLMGVRLESCKGYCVKWVRDVRPGVVRFQRTCSTKLKITMKINAVCIGESRPRSGKICFCEEDECNAANLVRPDSNFRTLMTVLIIVILVTCFR